VASVQNFERFVADAIAEPLHTDEMASFVDPDGDGDAWSVDGLVERKSAKGHRNPLLDDEFKRSDSSGTPRTRTGSRLLESETTGVNEVDTIRGFGVVQAVSGP
jgi:hypothetical protein